MQAASSQHVKLLIRACNEKTQQSSLRALKTIAVVQIYIHVIYS